MTIVNTTIASSTADRYLDALERAGVDVDELTSDVRRSQLLAVGYRDRFLPTPVFLTAAERTQLARDLLCVHELLVSLPDRLFEGSRIRLARAVGMTEAQARLVDSAPRDRLAPLARADLYRTHDGFKLLELNITSALGGFENAVINRTMLAHPALKDFVTSERLAYADTFAAITAMVRSECSEHLDGERPVIALVDWPESFRTYEPRLRIWAHMFAAHGFEALPCHVGQLSRHDGHLWLGERPVQVVLRFFLAEEVVSDDDFALVEPLIESIEAREVGLVSRLDTELYGNKGALALLSDDRHRDLFTADEQACIDRILPWTRSVSKRSSGPHHEPIDLVQYALDNQHELILKPTLLHGGSGIIAGWTVGKAEWSEAVIGALDGPYVLQERVRALAEAMPSRDGREHVFANWGVFIADPAVIGGDGYAGCIVRGAPDPEVGVVSMGSGARVGCCFHRTIAAEGTLA